MSDQRFKLTTFREMVVTCADTRSGARLPPGEHIMKQIPNPFGVKGDWLVCCKTGCGGTKENWEQLQNAPQPLDRVILEELQTSHQSL